MVSVTPAMGRGGDGARGPHLNRSDGEQTRRHTGRWAAASSAQGPSSPFSWVFRRNWVVPVLLLRFPVIQCMHVKEASTAGGPLESAAAYGYFSPAAASLGFPTASALGHTSGGTKALLRGAGCGIQSASAARGKKRGGKRADFQRGMSPFVGSSGSQRTCRKGTTCTRIGRNWGENFSLASLANFPFLQSLQSYG